jgi:hypothetical protein
MAMHSTHHLIALGMLQLACASDAAAPRDTDELFPVVLTDPDGEQTSSNDAPCSTHQQCIDRNAGAPYRCRASDARCVSLLNSDCPRVLGDAADIAGDDAIHIGLLVVDGPDGAEAEAAVDLARTEIASALGGGVRTEPTARVRPLVIVECNTDGGEPLAAVRHLVEEVEVSALLGGFDGGHVLSVARQVTIPRGVLQITPSATDDEISALDDQDLVYRAQLPGEILFQVLTPFIERILRPAIHRGVCAHVPEPVRMMLVYDPDPTGVSEAAAITKSLSVDGEPVPREGSAFYRELRLDPLNLLDPQPLSVVAARAIITFAPQVILYQTRDEEVLRAVESGWPTDVPKPYYIASPTFGARLPDLVGADADLRQRAFSLLGVSEGYDPASFDAWAARLRASAPTLGRPISHIFGPNLYDSMYMLADALSTLGDSEPTGLNLVPGFRRLSGPGTTIPFGPDAMPSALGALAAGNAIDYIGVNGAFHYTPAGDRSGLAAIGCVTIDAAGNATGLKPSGFAYDPASQSVVSADVSCP